MSAIAALPAAQLRLTSAQPFLLTTNRWIIQKQIRFPLPSRYHVTMFLHHVRSMVLRRYYWTIIGTVLYCPPAPRSHVVLVWNLLMYYQYYGTTTDGMLMMLLDDA